MGLTGVPGAGSLGTLGLGGLGEDPALLGPGGRMVGIDVGLGARQGNLGLNGVTQEPEVLHGGLDMLPPDASSTLFVDGLPLDCSRREAAHIFRPFIGFKEVRLVHKDAKRVVLCFVEFADARCAATALEALQGYKFDETDPDSYALRLSFARHPGPRGPPPREETYRGGGGRGTRESYDAVEFPLTFSGLVGFLVYTQFDEPFPKFAQDDRRAGTSCASKLFVDHLAASSLRCETMQ
ncbi:hypothetical protein R1sor_018033 [Riccia sorocarpa]|uniref:RRM domain-containing protein n=1 Tax=Riccia sorocarpa TaxID=122646 RepID=A0ABD3I8Y9_9MARC